MIAEATTTPESRMKRFTRQAAKVIALVPRAFALVWRAAPAITSTMLVVNVVAAILPVVTLWITKLLIDRVSLLIQQPHLADQAASIGAANLRPIWVLMAVLVGLWVTGRGAEALSSTLAGLARFRVEAYAQVLIMRKCSEVDLVFFENPQSLNMLENANRGARSGALNLVSMLLSFVRSVVSLAGFLAVLTRLHWGAALVVIAATAPQMVATSYFARRRWQITTDLAEDSRLRFYLTWLTSQREPAKEVRLFRLTDYFIGRFNEYCQKAFKIDRSLESRREAANFFLGLLGSAGSAAIWVYVILQAVARKISLGDIWLYTQAVSNCEHTLVALFMQSGQIYEQTLFLGNLFALLDLKPTEIDGSLRGPNGGPERSGNVPAPARIEHGIEFRNVSFRYPGSSEWIIRDLSFRIKPNESVAVVGRNGAGKTTLVKLLVRLYDPTEGEILLDNRNLREYDLDSLRGFFGVVFQDYAKYHLTLRENIGFGDVQRVGDVERVQKAAKSGGAEDIARRLPKQYETYLARQFMGLGEDLSGGEWQRVAISRVYMRDAPVFILDEPTASLDTFAEYEVYRGFTELAAGRNVILISHRFSTVRTADHILVLDGGRLAEEGTHEELLARRGLYASMYETQAERYR